MNYARRKKRLKSLRSANQVQYANLRVSAINLKKLAETAEHLNVLRLLRVYNDIATVTFLVQRLDTSYYPQVKPIRDGVFWAMLRWKVSIAVETLAPNGVIHSIVKQEKTADHALWKVINANQDLLKNWRLLETYMGGGSNYSFTKSLLTVRDKLAAHYDNAPITAAFQTLLSIREPDNIAQVPVGFHAFGDAALIRNLLTDELLNIALYEAFDIPVTKAGVDDKAVDKFGKDLGEFLAILGHCIDHLVHDYFVSNGLIEPNFDRPDWLDDKNGSA